jgi:lysophospholipase L1-like esterase
VLEGIVRYFKLAPAVFDYKTFEPMLFVDNPKICYKMRPFAACDGGRLNSEGYKDNEFVVPKDNHSVRIVMLGDSITKGTGIPFGKTFSDQLEALLNQRNRETDSGLEYEVMNFGVGGYNIVSEIETLRVYALKYKPDIVILNYFHNDNDLYSFNYWFFLEKITASSVEKNILYQYYLHSEKFRIQRVLLHSSLYTFCLARIYKCLQRQKGPAAQYEQYDKDIIREKLGELKELSQKNNFKILICMHPTLDYDKLKPSLNYDSTARAAEDLGLGCISLRQRYQDRSQDPRIFLRNANDKDHPNFEGHKLIAEALLNELEKNGMVRF